MKKKCSLIIGSSGFIGSKLKKSLPIEQTYSISLDKNKNTDHQNHFFVDLNKKNDLKKVFDNLSKEHERIEIYYLAGESSVENSIKSPEESISKSLSCILNVASLAKDINSTVVFASSGSIYDSRKVTFFDENSTVAPPSPYAAIKASSENILFSFYESFDLDIRIARIFSVFGENMNRFFIFDLIKKISSEEDIIHLNGDGNQKRDYLHVDDVVSGLKLIMCSGSKGETYNLCSGKAYSLKQIVKITNETLKIEKPILWNGKGVQGIRNKWYGANKKITALGFESPNTEAKLKDTIQNIYEKLTLD